MVTYFVVSDFDDTFKKSNECSTYVSFLQMFASTSLFGWRADTVGDLHPGNILVSRDTNVSGHPLRLHLLDCGLVVEMGPEQHVNLVKIKGAFARRNGRLAGHLMADTSCNCQASPVDIELFVRGIEHIL